MHKENSTLIQYISMLKEIYIDDQKLQKKS